MPVPLPSFLCMFLGKQLSKVWHHRSMHCVPVTTGVDSLHFLAATTRVHLFLEWVTWKLVKDFVFKVLAARGHDFAPSLWGCVCFLRSRWVNKSDAQSSAKASTAGELPGGSNITGSSTTTPRPFLCFSPARHKWPT